MSVTDKAGNADIKYTRNGSFTMTKMVISWILMEIA